MGLQCHKRCEKQVMQRLKADFHTHTADDPHDCIGHTTEELIDAAAGSGIQVLAITCHNARVYSEAWADYATERGILLVPGVEQQIEGRHVVILHPEDEHLGAKTFDDLRRMGKGRAVYIAPHPFYPVGCSLMERLLDHIDLFDAIEYASFYWYGSNLFNRKAARVARRAHIPMVGNSDTHLLPYCDSTFTWVTAEPTVEGVLDAIRQGRTEVVTRPRPIGSFLRMLGYALHGEYSKRLGSLRERFLRKDEEVVQE